MDKTNSFLSAFTTCDTFTENGAISNSTTGSKIVDQFGKSGSHRNRDLNLVFAEQSAVWGENPLLALRLPFYLRMVTRKSKLFDGNVTEKVQKGQGNRDESFKRLLWIAKYNPEIFYKNLWLLPIIGSWKDLWTLLSMDDSLNKEEFFKVLAMGIEDDYQRDLVKKYLPRIRSNKKATSVWASKTNALAKEFCVFLGWTPKVYRLFKSTGLAHKFQRDICFKLYDKLEFKMIPGRALTKIATSGFLKKHGLEKRYLDWIKNQPVAKFTGYVYELAKLVPTNTYGNSVKPLSLIEKLTIDKQFDGLIELAKKDQGGLKGNVWCCLDTSGSMNHQVDGLNGITASNIANSLAIYFSTLNEGAFHKHVLSFDSTSKLHKLSGSFCDMMSHLPSVPSGGTNFQSAIDEVIRVRRTHPEIPLSDYPTTFLVISDMQFSPGQTAYSYGYKPVMEAEISTNYKVCKDKLKRAFGNEYADNVKFIWWDCISRKKDQPSTINDAGTYVFSGFDGSVVTLLLGGSEVKIDETTGKVVQPSMEEMVTMALSQEVLEQINL